MTVFRALPCATPLFFVGWLAVGCIDVQVSSDDADADGDGYDNVAEGGTDCNDSDPEIHPDADEICDDVDNDCDGYVDCADEDVDDLDQDESCTCEDCDDLDPDNTPGKTEICDGQDNDCDGAIDNGLSFSDWYEDIDGDGHGDPDSLESTCDGPPDMDWVELGDDCDDLDPDNYPGNDEVCDGSDNDCDGLADCLDDDSTDADGDGVCACDDCDDLDPQNHTAGVEECDGSDNDCDGLVDCQDPDLPDTDGDGVCFCDDCDDANPYDFPGNTEDCDGMDNDCDGLVDCADGDVADADGDGVCACDDCDDGDAGNYPGNTELCDGMDNDCDGAIDEGVSYTDWYFDTDGDGHGNPAVVQSTCDGSPGAGWVTLGDDCDDTDPLNFPGNTEVCDGMDNYCYGFLDDGVAYKDWYWDDDGDGHGNPAIFQSDCASPGVGWVADGDDCDDSDANNFPGNTEVCDGYDNDCDHLVDEGCSEICDNGIDDDGDGWIDCDDPDCHGDPGCQSCSCVDADGDGYYPTSCTDPLCSPATDCDDNDPDNYPGNAEVCDGADNDCDGLADCDDADIPDADGDGHCECVDCDDNDAGVGAGEAEICDGLDNDCDGDVDEDFWGMNVGTLTCAIDPANPVCGDPAVSIASQVVDLDMSNLTGVTIALYTTDPTGWPWNVGDSPSNDCCCGDSSDRSHDAEVWIIGGDDLGVCSNDHYGWTDSFPDAIPASGSGWVEVTVQQDFLRMLGDGFCVEYTDGTFPLTGWDNEYGNNDDEMIHIGMNKVIAAGSNRTGTGLTLVELYYWP